MMPVWSTPVIKKLAIPYGDGNRGKKITGLNRSPDPLPVLSLLREKAAMLV
jgi:hypothetical protein